MSACFMNSGGIEDERSTVNLAGQLRRLGTADDTKLALYDIGGTRGERVVPRLLSPLSARFCHPVLLSIEATIKAIHQQPSNSHDNLG